MSASQHVAPKGRTIKLNSLAAAAAVVAIVSGFGLTHHGAAAAVQHAKPQSISQPAAARQVPAADPSLTWLGSAGGQAQVTFNNDVSTLAWALEAESKSPTVANHLVFESDARVVRTQAKAILSTPALLPAVHLAGYKLMLNDYITVANLLQPGPDYGTTAQDYTVWNAALAASNTDVS
jgi:hypothetical protein